MDSSARDQQGVGGEDDDIRQENYNGFCFIYSLISIGPIYCTYWKSIFAVVFRNKESFDSNFWACALALKDLLKQKFFGLQTLQATK